jgi:hypothetical protein
VRLVPLALILLAGLAAAALLDDEPGPPAPAKAAFSTPLLGLVDAERGHGALVRLHPRTLRPQSRRIRMRGYTWARAWSPDGRQLAVAVASLADARVERSLIQVIDVRRWRTTAVIEVSPHTEVAWLAWPAPRRLVGLLGHRSGAHGVVVVDPAARRVVRRGRVHGLVPGSGVRPAAGGLAAVVGPPEGIGPAALAHVTATGERRIPLAVDAGFDQPPLERTGPLPAARQRVPGLAVDCHRAYVVEAGGPGVAEVDLESGKAARHEPVEDRTLLERLRDLVEPAAEAKAVEGPIRQVDVIAPGRLAVTGWDDVVRGTEQIPRPYGLRIVDTETWRFEVADPRVRSFVPAPGALLVTDGGRGPRSGVVALDLDGRERFRLLEGRDASAIAAGGRLYATAHGPGRMHVVDLRSGRRIRVAPRVEIVTAAEPPCR